MSWVFNYFSKEKNCEAAYAELRAATKEEIINEPKRKTGWLGGLDWLVNCVATPIFVSFRTISGLILRTTPDLGHLNGLKNFYVSKNIVVLKEVFKYHRSDLEEGIFGHGAIGKPMVQVLKNFSPKVKLNDTILTCEARYTEIYRKLLLQFFAAKSMESHLPKIEEIAKKFAATWEVQGSILVNLETKRLGAKVMAEIFLGNSGSSDSISSAAANIFPWIAETTWSDLSPLYKKMIKHVPLMALLSSSSKNETIRVLQEAIAKSVEEAKNLANKAVLTAQMVEENYSPEQIHAMIVILFVAGQDNVSTTLTYGLLKLAQDPTLQEKIRKDTADPLQSTSIRSLLCESLRRVCPVAGVGRTLEKAAILSLKNENKEVISKTFLHPGDHLQALTYFVAQDPALYPKPETFDIDRHNNQSAFLPNLPFMPFGDGPHRCPGWYLFYAIAASTISHLAKNYTLHTSFRGDPKTQIRFVTQITDSISIDLQKRDS